MTADPNRAATLNATLPTAAALKLSQWKPALELQTDAMAATDSVKETAESVTETVKDAVGLGESSGGSSGGPSTSTYLSLQAVPMHNLVPPKCARIQQEKLIPRTFTEATREEMSAARVPLAYRDSCAHLLIRLNKCRYENYYLPWKCEVWRRFNVI